MWLLHSRQYLPRKGTETFLGILTSESLVSLFCSDSRQYLPRKGTETVLLLSVLISSKTFPTIFTPQGDGNENSNDATNLDLVDSRQYLPRKGTETASNVTDVALLATDVVGAFPTIFTPQGDGNLKRNRSRTIGGYARIPDNIYPARGRKL